MRYFVIAIFKELGILGEAQLRKIRIRFLSTMRNIVAPNETIIEVQAEATVGDLLGLIATMYGETMAAHLFQQDRKTMRSDILILINDVDIEVLDGIGPRLSEGDEVTLMPVAHGG